MGTRSLTHFEHNGEILCTVYRQMDGYPEGHGKDLAEFLSGYKIVNGINMEDDRVCPKLANGMGCLAAQVIAHFKTVDAERCKQRWDALNTMQRLYAAEGFHVKPDEREPVQRQFQVGSIYMVPTGSSGHWENYTYTVKTDAEHKLTLKVTTGRGANIQVLFDGIPENYNAEEINKSENSDA